MQGSYRNRRLDPHLRLKLSAKRKRNRGESLMKWRKERKRIPLNASSEIGEEDIKLEHTMTDVDSITPYFALEDPLHTNTTAGCDELKAHRLGISNGGVLIPKKADFLITELLHGQYSKESGSLSDDNDVLNLKEKDEMGGVSLETNNSSLVEISSVSWEGTSVENSSAHEECPKSAEPAHGPTQRERLEQHDDLSPSSNEPSYLAEMVSQSIMRDNLDTRDEMADSLSVAGLSAPGPLMGSARREVTKESADVDATQDSHARKVRLKMEREKARRDVEVQRGELEIQELQKSYWRERVRAAQAITSHEEALFQLLSAKIKAQTERLLEKARREEEVQSGEREIQALQRVYWQERINTLKE